MPFERPALAELIPRIRNDFEGRLDGVDARLRRSVVNTIATVQAGAVHGLYGYLAFLAQQVIPSTATGEFLDRWLNLWLPDGRKPAAAARGSVTFTGTDGTTIPGTATVLTRSDGAEYTVDADVVIAAGSAVASVTASVAGTAGNSEPGTTFNLASPIVGVNAAASVGVDGIANGFEAESDADAQIRLALRIQEGAPNGKDSDYIQWALEIAGVTRAWCFPLWLGLGTVGVTFVLDNQAGSVIPDAGKVAEVQAHIDAQRPSPSSVTVFAPTADPFNPTIRVAPNTQAVKDAVTAELVDLLRRDASPGGTVLLSRINEAISSADGEIDHALSSPIADVVSSAGHILVPGAPTWV